MKNKLIIIFLSVIFAFISRPVNGQNLLIKNDSGLGRTFINERIIVKFKGNLDPEVEEGIFFEHKLKKHKFIKELNSYVVLTSSKNETLNTIEKLKKRKDVEFAEPDMYCEPVGKFETPNDAGVSQQWWVTKINLPQAWDINKGSSNIIIAIIDSGCDATHPDLITKYVPGYNFFDLNSVTQDVRGHGTAVAGCAAAATNNSIGVAGAGRNCMIMPIRVTDSAGYAYWSTIAQAMKWATDKGARVANASFACGESTTIQSAAKYMNSKNGVFCCSAGNQAKQLTSVNFPEIIVVGATDSNDNLASFSNWGLTVDVVAPGVICYTTNLGGGYQWWSGTSFSSPITAGLVGLILSTNNGLKPSDVDSILKRTSKDLGDPGIDLKYSNGRIDALAAVTLAANTVVAPPPPPPSPDTQAPLIKITSPINGSVVTRGIVRVQSSSSDNVGVVRVELYVDGSYITNSSVAPFTINWNSINASAGQHTMVLKAIDAAGNVGISAAINVILN